MKSIGKIEKIGKSFIILLILSIYMIPITMGDTNNSNVTNTPTVTQTAASIQTTTPVQTTQPSITTPVQTVQPIITPAKFRVGPTVRIRPLNDEIKKDQDGLVELYMDNPSLNDIPLSVDARISVPSGIHVYGQGFGEAGAAGMVYGKFDIPPGTARTINIVIKAEKVGDFSAQFTGMYWPGDNKDAYQPISLSHPFKVLQASEDPNSPGTATQTPPPKTPGMTAIIAIFAIVVVVVLLKKR